MISTDTFTDIDGHVCLDGKREPRLRVVGWCHVHPCPQYRIATVEIGRNLCDCDGKVLIGWTGEWPLGTPPQDLGPVVDAL